MMLLLVLCCALFAGHFVKGITGFGSALVSIPILSFVFAPADAIVIALMCDVCIGAYLTWSERKNVLWRILCVMVLGALGGQYIGISLQSRLDPDGIRLCMAIVIAIFAFRVLRGMNAAKKREYLPHFVGMIAGFGSGAMGGLVGSSGPPVVFFTTSYYEKEKGRSLLFAFFFFSSITLIIGMMQGNLIQDSTIQYGGIGIVVSLIAARLGSWVMPHVSQEWFMRGVAILLLMCSISMLVVIVRNGFFEF
jgi:uncharacterized membrane protein YfcA